MKTLKESWKKVGKRHGLLCDQMPAVKGQKGYWELKAKEPEAEVQEGWVQREADHEGFVSWLLVIDIKEGPWRSPERERVSKKSMIEAGEIDSWSGFERFISRSQVETR